MRVVGVVTKKLTKTKAVLIVNFLTPQSLKDVTMQMMYCTSLEPKRGLGQGADFSVLTAINYAFSHAKSLHDIGVRAMSAADVKRAMLADLNSLKAIPKPPLIPNTMTKPCVVLCAQNGSKAKTLRCKDFGVARFFRKFCARHSLLKIHYSFPLQNSDTRYRESPSA